MNEWYTPFRYVEAAREVMGGIDLDPASCERANQVVQATRFYTAKENGLMQPWHGNVWLNPPYGNCKGRDGKGSTSLQSEFVKKLLLEYYENNVQQAILLLLGNSCFNKTYRPLWDYLACFHEGAIIFQKADESWDKFGFGTIFVYLGGNEQAFIDIFSRFGRIVRAIDTPRPQAQPLSLWEARAV